MAGSAALRSAQRTREREKEKERETSVPSLDSSTCRPPYFALLQDSIFTIICLPTKNKRKIEAEIILACTKMFSRRLAFVAVLLLLMLLHGTAGASAFIFSSKEEKEGTKGTEAAELGVGSELLGFKAYEDMRRQGQDTFLLLQKKSKEEVEEKERGEEEERGLSLSANNLLKSLFSLKQKESIGCWTQCLGQMEKSCNAKTDDEMKKLAFMFTNCHLEESGLGRVTWDRMKRNEKAFSAYTGK